MPRKARHAVSCDTYAPTALLKCFSSILIRYPYDFPIINSFIITAKDRASRVNGAHGLFVWGLPRRTCVLRGAFGLSGCYGTIACCEVNSGTSLSLTRNAFTVSVSPSGWITSLTLPLGPATSVVEATPVILPSLS